MTRHNSYRKEKNIFFPLLLVMLLLAILIFTAEDKNTGENYGKNLLIAKEFGYGVSAAHPLAVEAGMAILRQGGNAVDAAIAVSYVLGVVEPYASGIGGGGAMLIYTSEGEAVAFDYREIYPLSGTMPSKGVGVPGFVKGMEEIHREFGSLAMEQLIEPAIKIAQEGFPAGKGLNERLRAAKYRLTTTELQQFYPQGQPVPQAALLKQPLLVNTLNIIKEQGSDGFYKGPVAQKIAAKVKGLALSDFVDYTVRKSMPVHGQFAGYEVLSAPPPLGGVTLIQSLQMAEALDISKTKDKPLDFLHLLGEINKRSYRDRLSKIGDPFFVDVPVKALIAEEYSHQLASQIPLDKLTSIDTTDDSPGEEADHNNTTHFVVVDQKGMMVSVTNTLSNFFGSGIYVEGFFMNNQLLNFSKTPTSINRPYPGKRPRSYISPTILVKAGKPVLGIGSPGGRRIPAMLAQVLIENLTFEEDLQKAVEAPRFFVEDSQIFMEKGFSNEIKEGLKKRGYKIQEYDNKEYYGAVQALGLDYQNKNLLGAADPRREGTWKAEKP